MRRTLLAVACAMAVLAAAPAAAREGREVVTAPSAAVHVVDGDTLELEGRLLDLYGVDAPELGQSCAHAGNMWRCGVDAAFSLRKLIALGRGDVRCTLWRADVEPPRAVCEGAGRDLALTLIGEGSAVASPNSFPDYLEAQNSARSAGLGLWRGPFALPWDWRSGSGLAEDDTPLAAASCAVKGLVIDDGRQAYYVPTDPGYDRMQVDREAGGRCFASDEAARQAGWRRPR